MKQSVLIIILCVMSLAVLNGAAFSDSKVIPDPVAANSMEPADPALLSKPLEPWSLEPVPVDTMYLVLPFLKDGKMESWGYAMTKELQEGIIPCLSRSMGITRSSYTWTMIHAMSEYSNDDVIELTGSVAADVIKISNPTHVISDSYVELDGRWSITVTVKKGAAEWTNTFDVPKGQFYLLRRDVVSWMVECGALKVSDETARAAATMLPYGEKVLAYDDKLADKITSDPHHEEWTTLVKKYGENDYHQFLRLCAAINAEDQEMIKKLTPGPLDKNASFFKRLARKQSLKHQGELDAARHELELILATYPGIFGQANAYISHTFSKGQMREDYVHAVEQWCRRVSQYPRANVLAGRAMKDAAWDYLGSGLASTVSPNARKKFRESGLKGVVFYETAMECGIPEPKAVNDLMFLKMVFEGDKEGGVKLHRKTSERYPDESETWSMVLEYNSVRRGGSNELATRFMEEMLASRPDNLYFGSLVVHHHLGEALYESSNGHEGTWTCVKDYCQRYPDRRKQIADGIERIIGDGASDTLVGYALSAAAATEERQLIQMILTKYPDAFECLTESSSYTNWFGRSRYYAIYHMASLGQWKQLRKAIPQVRAQDEAFRQDPDKQFCIAFWDDGSKLNAYEALAIAMGGDFDKGIKLMEAISPHPDYFLFLPYIRAHYACITNKDLEDIQAYANHYTNDPDPYYIRALYYLKKKDNNYALKEVEKARSKSGSPRVCLKAEVDRLVAKLEAAQGGQ